MPKKYLFVSFIVFTALYFGSIGAGLLPESFLNFFGGGNAQLAAVGSSKTSTGVSYQVTAELPLSDARSDILASSNQNVPSGFMVTIGSAASLSDIRIQDADMPPQQPQQDSTQGYIIQFTERPLAVKYKELQSQIKAGASLQSVNMNAALAAHKALIVKQQDAFLAFLPNSVKAKNPALFTTKPPRFNAV